MCPGRLFYSQVTCRYPTVGMMSLLGLSLFSLSLVLALQCFLTLHFFSSPSKHCKIGMDKL